MKIIKYNEFINEGLWNNIKKGISDFTTSDEDKQFIKFENDANNVKNDEDAVKVKREFNKYLEYLNKIDPSMTRENSKKIINILHILTNKYNTDFK